MEKPVTKETDRLSAPLVDAVLIDFVERNHHAEGDEWAGLASDHGQALMRVLLNNFAASVVREIAPADTTVRALIFENARTKGIQVEPNEGKPWTGAELAEARERFARKEVFFRVARALARDVNEVADKFGNPDE
jgi:hypothetical protein